MLKQFDIKKTLEQIEDYDAFYDKDDLQNDEVSNDLGKVEEDSDDERLNSIFSSKNEMEFYRYGEDMDFVRYHKRMTRNF